MPATSSAIAEVLLDVSESATMLVDGGRGHGAVAGLFHRIGQQELRRACDLLVSGRAQTDVPVSVAALPASQRAAASRS